MKKITELIVGQGTAAVPRALSAGAILASFLYLLRTTWLTWGSLVVDTPRELWVPLQLLEGRVLYRDVVYQFGFLPPYFIAGLYRLFGVSSHTAVGCGIVVTALESVFLYRLSRLFLPRLLATVTVVTFLFVLAFAHYSGNHIFNFILPYAFPSTFCTLFLTMALYFFLKFTRRPGRSHYLLGSLGLLLATLSRPEMALPFHLLFLAAGAVFLASRRCPGKDWLLLPVPALASLAAYGVFFTAFGNVREFRSGFADIISLGLHHPMVREWAGLDDVPAHLLRLVTASVLMLAVVAAAIVIPSLLTAAFSGRRRLLSLVGAVLLVPPFVLAVRQLLPADQYYGYPLLLGVGLLASLARLRRGYDADAMAAAVFYGAALAMLPRMLLNTGPSFYGFYLLTLPLVAGNVLLVNLWLPLVERFLPVRTRAAPLVMGVLLLFQASACWQVSRSLYAEHRRRFTSARGTMICPDDRATAAIQGAVDHLRQRTPPGSTVVGFPLGYAFSFFGERRMPLRDGDFTYWRMAPAGERSVVASLDAARIDYAVLMSYTRPEDGYEVFGRDYARELFRWLVSGYRPVRQIGPVPFTAPEFGVTIFQRAGAPAPAKP